MPMKIYSLVLFISMISYLGRLIYLSKDQDRFYKALLYSVVVFYILAFINDFPHIFLGEERSILGKYFTEGLAPFFFIMFFLILLQFFLFLKFYPFRWIYSGFYWVLCVRFVAYPYDVSFSGEGQILLYIAGGSILIVYLWVILFIYHKKWYCKILLWILSFSIFVCIFIQSTSIDLSTSFLMLTLKPLGIFAGLIAFSLVLLGGPIFYIAFYIGEIFGLAYLIAILINRKETKNNLKENS